MIIYLVNFTLCSALMLLAYQLLLKNKAMYRFNRLYLLGSILFSLVVPLIVVKQPAPMHTADRGPQPEITTYQVLTEVASVPQNAVQSVQFNPADYAGAALLTMYTLISVALLYRFGKNLYTISATIRKNKTIPYRGARLVLIPQKLTPHTFLDCIFLNSDEYLNHEVDDAVLQHELAHARQRHTADVIVIELLRVFCWFNPVLLLYRKAIRLNHEFLADDAVLSANYNMISYQTLLVNKLTDVRSLGITSQFNYSVTKKRLMMMTKKTSATAAWISRLALMPVLIVAFTLFCTKTQAVERMVVGNMMVNNMMVEKAAPRETDTAKAIKKSHVPVIFFDDYPYTKAGVSVVLVKEYAALEVKYGMDKQPNFKKFKQISAADKARFEEIYKQMSQAQQRHTTIVFSYSSKPAPLKKITHQQLLEWAGNPRTYGVWINNKRFDNGDLTTYRADELGLLLASILTPVAIKKDGFKIQVNLMTKDFYAKYRKDELANRFKANMYFRFAPPVIINDQASQAKPDSAAAAQSLGWVDYRYLAPGFADLRKSTPGC
jgi:bla regulator protein BlaR1